MQENTTEHHTPPDMIRAQKKRLRADLDVLENVGTTYADPERVGDLLLPSSEGERSGKRARKDNGAASQPPAAPPQQFRHSITSLFHLGATMNERNHRPAAGAAPSSKKSNSTTNNGTAAGAVASDAFLGRLTYPVSKIVTEGMTTEQIWGQLNVLYAPLLTQAPVCLQSIADAVESHDTSAEEKAAAEEEEEEAEEEQDEEGEGAEEGEEGEDDEEEEEELDEEAEEAAKEKSKYNPFGDVPDGESDATLSDDEEDEAAAPGEEEEGEEIDEDAEAADDEIYGEGAGTLFERGDEFDNMNGDNGDDVLPEDVDAEEDRLSGDEAIKEHRKAAGEGDDEEEEPDMSGKTPFERKEYQRLKEAREREEARIYGTHWTMQGEVSGRMRPRDSLLNEEVQFDHGAKSVPVITETTTAKLEDRIKKRILDSNYDDVQRKVAMTTAKDLAAAISNKGKAAKDFLEASQKSKLSLVDLYEKEFIEKQKKADAAEGGDGGATTAEPLTEVEKDELRAIQMFKRLAQHLDALSNFYFTPLPVQEELDARVRATLGQGSGQASSASRGVAALEIESVGNLAKSTEAALAPQDVHRPYASSKALTASIEEMNPRERQAYRRAQKERQSDVKERIAAKADATKEKHDSVFKQRQEVKAAAAAANTKRRH